MDDKWKDALFALVEAIEEQGGITYERASAGYLLESGPHAGKMSTGIAFSPRLSEALGRASDLLRSRRRPDAVYDQPAWRARAGSGAHVAWEYDSCTSHGLHFHGHGRWRYAPVSYAPTLHAGEQRTS